MRGQYKKTGFSGTQYKPSTNMRWPNQNYGHKITSNLGTQASTQDTIHIVSGENYYTATTGGGLRRMKTRTLLFKSMNRLGMSDPKTLDHAQDLFGNRMSIQNGVIVAEVPKFFAGNNQITPTMYEGTNDADKANVMKMITMMSMEREQIRQNSAEALAGIDRDGFPSTFKRDTLKIENFMYRWYRFKADEFGKTLPPVQQSDAWYAKNGYQILNTQRGISVSAPVLSQEASESKYFLPYCIGCFGTNPDTKVIFTNKDTSNLIGEGPPEGSNMRQQKLDEMFATMDAKYKRMQEQLGDSIHLAMPYYRSATEQANRIIPYEELLKHAAAQNPPVDVQSSISKQAYDDYIARVKAEAQQLDEYAAQKKQPQGSWTFRGRTLYASDLKEYIYIAVPMLNERGFIPSRMRYTQTYTIKRTQLYYRRLDILFHDGIRFQKSGFMRVQGMNMTSNLRQILEDESQTLNSKYGIQVRLMQGGKIYPKMNRYMRNNIIMSLEYENFKRRVLQNPVLSYSMAAYGIIDIDDQMLRTRLMDAEPSDYIFVTLMEPFKLSKSQYWKNDWEERKRIENDQRSIIDRRRQARMGERANAYFKALNMVNRQLVSHYRRSSLSADTKQIIDQYAGINPWSVCCYQLFTLVAMTGVSTQQDDAGDVFHNGIQYRGYTTAKAKRFEHFFERYQPKRPEDPRFPTGQELAQIMANMIIDSAQDGAAAMIRQVEDDEVNWIQMWYKDAGTSLQTQDIRFKAIVASIYSVSLEMQETFLSHVVHYQSQDFKNISDVQYYTYIVLMGYMFQYQMVVFLNIMDSLYQTATLATEIMEVDPADPHVFIRQRGMSLYAMRSVGYATNSRLYKSFLGYIESYWQMIQKLTPPRESKVNSISKFFSIFRDSNLSGGRVGVVPITKPRAIQDRCSKYIKERQDYWEELRQFQQAAQIIPAQRNSQPSQAQANQGNNDGGGPPGGGAGDGNDPGNQDQPRFRRFNENMEEEGDQDYDNNPGGPPQVNPNQPQMNNQGVSNQYGGGNDPRASSLMANQSMSRQDEQILQEEPGRIKEDMILPQRQERDRSKSGLSKYKQYGQNSLEDIGFVGEPSQKRSRIDERVVQQPLPNNVVDLSNQANQYRSQVPGPRNGSFGPNR